MKLSLRALLSLLLSVVVLFTGMGAWAQDEAEGAIGSSEPAIEAPAKPAAPAKVESRVVLEAKIDVNNTILRNYRQMPGFYPVLARILVQNAPYDKVEDVLKISGLTDGQKALLKENLSNFVAGPYEAGNNSLENRINKGYYG